METDWGDLPDVPAVKAEIVRADKSRPGQMERLRELEDELLEDSIEMTRNVVRFADLPEGTETVPEEWIETMGLEAAQRKFRHASAAWRSTKTAPAALGIGASVFTKIIKARSIEKAAPRTLAIVLMPSLEAPRPVFEVRDVDDD
jgi:hypothetical protein